MRRADPGESTAVVAARIAGAAAIQAERQGRMNAELPPTSTGVPDGMDRAVRGILDSRGRQLGLSMRRLHRAARVARTIADLDGGDAVRPEHLDEALVHRPKELRA